MTDLIDVSVYQLFLTQFSPRSLSVTQDSAQIVKV